MNSDNRHREFDRQRTVIVIAPHQDDEIDLAAYALLNLNSWNKFILYSTNGDNKTPAETRFKEAIRAARELGVPKENLIFLGYGDNQEARTCAFYAKEDPIKSASGHVETYGAYGIEEYHYRKFGTHSPYTYDAFKSDLKSAILDVEADLIICVDFDSHIDHRMLSLAFDEVMDEILSVPNNHYFPEVLKRFGYALSYFAPEDYTPKCNKANVIPPKESYKSEEFPLIGKSLYQWSDRVLFPASGNKGLFLSTHKIIKALKCHVSQYSLFRAMRMDNSDEAFWRKRTDNLALIARVTADKGDATKVNDFKYFDTLEIDNIACSFTNDTWCPDGIKPEISFSWEHDIEIKKIVIYGSVLGDGYNGRVNFLFDTDILTQDISLDAKPVTIQFDNLISTRSLKIVFIDGFLNKNGIAEIEIYNCNEFKSLLDDVLIVEKKIGDEQNKENLSLNIVLAIDLCWLKFMRVKSHLINYYSLYRRNGFTAVASKINRRLKSN